MSKFNFFARANISTTNFSNSIHSFKFISSGLSLMNLSSTPTDVVEYSFDGVTIHGDLSPALPSAALAFDNRFESRIWFRLQSAGSDVTVRIEAWAVG